MHSVRAATELGEGRVRVTTWGTSGEQAGAPHSSNDPPPQSHSLGVVVAILSVDIKLLALRKDGGWGGKKTKMISGRRSSD